MYKIISVEESFKRPYMPLGDVNIPVLSAATIGVSGVPAKIGMNAVTAVTLRVMNVDGVILELPAVKDYGGIWFATFPSSTFVTAGRVENGLHIKVTAGGEDHIAGNGAIVVGAYGAQVTEIGDTAAYAVKGDDIYVKTDVIDGVQHYAKQVVTYDSEMEAYGASWSGDYILNANGEFVEA